MMGLDPNKLLTVQPKRFWLTIMNLNSAQAVHVTEQTERIYALLKKLTRKLLQFGMHFEIVRLKLGLFIEGLTAGLTCVPWMCDTIMLLPFLFTVECFAAYFTFILILSHYFSPFSTLCFSFKRGYVPISLYYI